MRRWLLALVLCAGCATPVSYQRITKIRNECYQVPVDLPRGCRPMWIGGEEFRDCVYKKDGTIEMCREREEVYFVPVP